MRTVLVEGNEVFKGTYEQCVAYCKRNGYMVYNSYCWDFSFADVAIVQRAQALFFLGAPATAQAGANLARLQATEKIVCEKKLKKIKKIFPKPLDKSGNIGYTNYRKKEREVKKNDKDGNHKED